MAIYLMTPQLSPGQPTSPDYPRHVLPIRLPASTQPPPDYPGPLAPFLTTPPVSTHFPTRLRTPSLPVSIPDYPNLVILTQPAPDLPTPPTSTPPPTTLSDDSARLGSFRTHSDIPSPTDPYPTRPSHPRPTLTRLSNPPLSHSDNPAHVCPFRTCSDFPARPHSYPRRLPDAPTHAWPTRI